METWLQEGKQIDGVVAHNDEMALGAYNAVRCRQEIKGPENNTLTQQKIAGRKANATCRLSVRKLLRSCNSDV